MLYFRFYSVDIIHRLNHVILCVMFLYFALYFTLYYILIFIFYHFVFKLFINNFVLKKYRIKILTDVWIGQEMSCGLSPVRVLVGDHKVQWEEQF
jgi:hypothetical protein